MYKNPPISFCNNGTKKEKEPPHSPEFASLVAIQIECDGSGRAATPSGSVGCRAQAEQGPPSPDAAQPPRPNRRLLARKESGRRLSGRATHDGVSRCRRDSGGGFSVPTLIADPPSASTENRDRPPAPKTERLHSASPSGQIGATQGLSAGMPAEVSQASPGF